MQGIVPADRGDKQIVGIFQKELHGLNAGKTCAVMKRSEAKIVNKIGNKRAVVDRVKKSDEMNAFGILQSG